MNSILTEEFIAALDNSKLSNMLSAYANMLVCYDPAKRYHYNSHHNDRAYMLVVEQNDAALRAEWRRRNPHYVNATRIEQTGQLGGW